MKYISNNQLNYNVKQLNNLSKKFNVPIHIIKRLFSLNIKTEKDIVNFFNPGLNQFYNPFLLKGMKEATEIINNAIKNNKSIVVVGDYDTDGICATAILYKYFESIGKNINYFLPNRFLDGYGLTNESIDKIIELYNPDLLITVDCGISCYNEIEYAKSKGLTVIVTDHHEVPPQKPNCLCIDPKDPNQTYPFKELCGAGVALKVVHALGGLEAYLKLTNIATLATVADIVPLINENRAIVRHGLQNQAELPVGVKKLLNTLKINELTSTDIAFKLAPKINTAGRMGDATLAFKLFIEKNQNVLNQTLTELENLNNARIEAGNDIYNDAINMLKNINISSVGAIVLKSETWHSGVLGIVCAKLTEKFNRPVCLLTKVENEYKGSIRSVNGIDIYKELLNCSNLLVKFGGHAGAAGLTILEHNINKFIETLNKNILSNYPSSVFDSVKYYDIDCNKENIDVNYVKSLSCLEPFGFGNEKPIFKLTFNSYKPERIKNHPNYLKIKTPNMELLSFNLADHILSLNTNCNKNVLLDVSIDSFKGQEKVKAIIKSISYEKLNTNIKTEENVAYSLSQLVGKNLNFNNKIKTINSLTQATNLISGKLGNLFVCYSYSSYKFVLENFGGFIENIDSFSIKSSSGNNTLIYLPISFNNFNNYSNIFFFDEILTKEFLNNFNSNIILYPVYKNTMLKNLNVDRTEFAKYHTAIVSAEKHKLASYSLVEYFNQLKRLNPQFKGLKLDQFTFVIIVLNELNIIEIISDEVNFSISINKNVVNPLTNSKIYNFVSLINKI